VLVEVAPQPREPGAVGPVGRQRPSFSTRSAAEPARTSMAIEHQLGSAWCSTLNKVLALAATEVVLVLRNKTVAVSSVVLPVAPGVFWVFTFPHGGPGDVGNGRRAAARRRLAMTVYVTATQTVVARRHRRVLTRLRTSGVSDTGVLVATVAPGVAIGLVQLAVFAVINAVAGARARADHDVAAHVRAARRGDRALDHAVGGVVAGPAGRTGGVDQATHPARVRRLDVVDGARRAAGGRRAAGVAGRVRGAGPAPVPVDPRH
jgi:hypothetical protein